MTTPFPHAEKTNILLVDLLEEETDFICSLIDDDFFRALKPKTVAEARQMCEENIIEGVFINISSLDGYEKCRVIAQVTQANIPRIFAICDQINTKSKQKAFEAGAVDFLIRPIIAPEIVPKLNSIEQYNHLKNLLKQHQTTEEMLRHSENRYSKLIENLPNSALIMFDREKRFLVVDGPEVKNAGLNSTMFVGQTIYDSPLPPSFIEIAAANMNRVLAGESFTMSIPFNEFVHSYYYTPIFSKEGELDYGLILAQNVTAQVKMESALRFSEEKFAQAFYSSPDSVTLSDPEWGRFIDVNEGFENLTGYSKEEVVGRSTDCIDLWVDPDKRLEMVDLLKREGQLREFEFDLRTKNGLIKNCLLSVSFIKVGGESLLVGVARDITEQCNAEESLRLLVNRQQFLHDLDRAIMGAKQPKVIAQSVVAPLLELFDCPHVSISTFDPEKSELVTLAAAADPTIDISKLPHQAPLDAAAVQVLEATQDHLTVDLEKMPVLDETGEFLVSQGIRAFIIYSLVDDGVLVGTLNLGLSDTTALSHDQLDIARQVSVQLVIALRQASLLEQLRNYTVELERQVEHRTHELRAKTRELEAFNYSVSHDLRAPLRAIDAFSKAVADQYSEDLPEKGQFFLSRVRFNSRRMGELIDDLLMLSRLSLKELVSLEVDMNQIVGDIIDSFKHDGQLGNIQIEIEDLPKAEGDPSLIRQVWVNLLSNAFKYSREHPEPLIKVGVQTTEDHPVYYVKDNGIGFDMQYYDRVFGVFERLVTNEQFEGTGIGLAIVKRIINRHNGEVWAEGAVDQGATFYFSISNQSLEIK